MRIIFIVTALLVCGTSFFAQKRFDSWGVVSPEDLAMTSYPADSSASAVILHDVGNTRIDENDQKWFVTHTHLRRIKVFKLASFDQSSLNILVRAGRSGERLEKLKVQHILPNGTAVKVPSDNLHLEMQNKYYDKMKIFVPQLQDGSIVEYYYELKSDYLFSLYDWYFHQELPVRWSEITTQIRSEFEYQFLARSERKFDQHTSTTMTDNSVALNLGLGNLAAMKEEPYMTTLDDYRAHVGFQLSHFYPRNAEPRNIMVSWQKTAQDLNNRQDFGRQIEKNNNFNDLWDAFEPTFTPGAAPMDIAQKALDFVRSSIRWNGEYRLFTGKDIDDAFEKKAGSSAEINLALVALLKRANLDAVPVMVSTRNNGATYEAYPFVEQFNSVLAMLRLNGQDILMDATHPFLPPGQLRTQYYNKRGWPVVDSKDSPWIDIVAPETGFIWLGNLVLDEQGQLSGRFEMSAMGPNAAIWRERLSDQSPTNFLKKEFATDYADAVFDSIVVLQQNDLEKPLQLKFFTQIPNTSTVVNDFIYLRPILDFYVTENPFKSLHREFPINFTHPIKAQYIVKIALPAGYIVEEFPSSVRINMPNKEGSILFSCEKTEGQKMTVILKMALNKSEYPAEAYDTLRQYFTLIGEKVATQIVIKKQ